MRFCVLCVRASVRAALAFAFCAAPPLAAKEWEAWASPAAAGFDAAKLEAAHEHADAAGSGAVVAVFRGRVIAAWGDIDRPFSAHSVRKSLMSGLYGVLSEERLIDLDATLGALGIDDVTPLTDQEKQATVKDVISARSGVYLPAAYAPAGQDEERPERGAHPPGSFWYYNNWDFNIAGVIIEQATGKSIYDAFDKKIARPLGMQDYDPKDGFAVYEPSQSRHPALTFKISARDLARFGQLYLDQGDWRGKRVLSADWVHVSTEPVSDFGDGTGYGYMWWTYAPGALGENYPLLAEHDLYMGRGTGGQAIFVIPDAGLIVAHSGDTDNGRPVRGFEAWRIAEMILAARTGEADVKTTPVSVAPVPFKSQLPAAPTPDFAALKDEERAEYEGEYDAGGPPIRVFKWRDRLFANYPGRGEAELFALGDDRFTIRVVAGVSIEFERDAAGNVSAMTTTLGEEVIYGVRR